MKIDVQSLHFDADQKLIDFIQKKMDKLDLYYDRIISGEIILRLDNDDSKENKLVEIKLEVPGNNLFAKKTAKSFEEAVDDCSEALRRQVKKMKEKLSEVH